jgi:hypothetical protein
VWEVQRGAAKPEKLNANLDLYDDYILITFVLCYTNKIQSMN